MISVGLFGLLSPTATKAATGINNAMNFQGRLLNAQGATVPDGTYNIQFKIYQDGTGTATGDPGGTLLWTENWVYATGSPDNRVQVTNGYFSVQLGSLCPMNATTCTSGTGNTQTNTVVNFNSNTLWLSVNIGNTSTASTFSGASGDGEMVPMKRLAANPYAFNAGQLGGIAASGFGQLSANNTYSGTNLFNNNVTIQGTPGTSSNLAFTANTTTGAVTIGGSLQATATNTLALDSSISGGAITIGAANATSISIGRSGIGVTIPASSSLKLGTASSQTGAIIFANSSNAYTLTLQSGVTSAALTHSFVLPTADGSNGQCLETDGSGNLNFGSCTGGASFVNQQLSNLSGVAINTSLLPGSGVVADLGSGTLPFGNLYLYGTSTPSSNNFKLSGASTHGTEVFNLPDVSGTSTICVVTGTTQYCPTTLQSAYTSSTGGTTPEILLNATQGGLNIQDASTTIGGNLLNVRSSAGNNMFSVGNTGAVTIQQSAASTTALQVLNNAGTPASVLTADTQNSRVGVDVTYTQMSAPTIAVNTSGSLTGDSLGAHTYYYKVTAIDAAGGETNVSNEVSQTFTSGTTNWVQLIWGPVAGATGYRVYRGTTAGGETGYYSTLGTTASGFIVFTDTGALQNNPSASPPTGTQTQAYTSTNVTNNNLQLSVGGNGTPTGQLYVSGTVPTAALGGLYTSGIGGTNLVANGRYLYQVGFFTDGATIDISNPATPSITASGLNIYGGPSVMSGRYLISMTNSFASIAAADMATASGVPSYGTATTTTAAGTGIAVQGRYAYATEVGTPGTLQAFDVSNPTSILPLGSGVTTGNTPAGLAISGKYAYVINNASSTLQTFDISNPSSMVSQGTVATTGTPNAITISGRYAYVAEGTTSGTLQIFDLSNPSSPVSIASLSISQQTPQQIAVSGRYVYIANATSTLKLQAYDVSNPVAPAALSASTPLAAGAVSMVVQGRYAYILESNYALQTFDLGGEYSQSLEAGNAELGTLTVDGNESIIGNSTIAGGLSVGQSLDVQGSLAVGGTFTPQTASGLSDPSVCSSTLPGAIYYNTTTNTMRECQNSWTSSWAWTDIVSDQDLGLLAYGVMPDSGAYPGDIASVNTNATSGPCKVSWASTTSVNISACIAYSGGRKVNVAAQTITGLSGTSKWYHLYVDPASSTGITNSGAQSSETAGIPTFSATAPYVNLADIFTNSSGLLSSTTGRIYDTRVFTTSAKSFATFDGNSTSNASYNNTGTITGAGLGWGVIQSTTAGLVNSATYTTAAGIRGVIVATTGTDSATAINSIIVTSGPVFIKSTGTSATNGTIISTTTAGYVGTGTANTALFANYGISQETIATSCSTASGALTSCQFSQLTDLNIR